MVRRLAERLSRNVVLREGYRVISVGISFM